MRPIGFPTIVLAAAALAGGCGFDSETPAGDDLLGAVVQTPLAVVADDPDDGAAPDTKPAAAATANPDPSRSAYETIVSGAVAGYGDFKLYDLGGGLAGDEWRVAPEAFGNAPFLVVLLNADEHLLQRQIVTSSTPLVHVLRSDCPSVLLGVAPSYGTDGGSFQLQLALAPGVQIPAPRPQVVWLNFDAGVDVRVQSRAPISYAAFDAATLGSAYAGHTAQMRAAIVAAMRADFAAYDVALLSSDEGVLPNGPYSTLYFGGNDSRLLGLADNVDQYNSNVQQTAVIYVEGFADFAPMRLSVEDMAQMIANTASHELGHLLGLFHTHDATDLMDTSGSAWDLARNQDFTTGVLEETVFPTGFENSPHRLVEAVGQNPAARISVTKSESTAKILHKAELRALVRQELRSRCGTCLHPDP